MYNNLNAIEYTKILIYVVCIEWGNTFTVTVDNGDAIW